MASMVFPETLIQKKKNMVTTDGTPFGNISLNVFRGAENGPPLVFVHGVLRCWQDFRPLFPYFGYDWTCHAVDHRGHGESERAGGDYEVLHYAGDIIQFIESQFEVPVVIYGHSLGAMVAAVAAAELGNRIAGAILEDPPFHTMGDRIAQTPLLSYFQGVRDVVNRYREPWEIGPALAEIEIVDPRTQTVNKLADTRSETAILFAAKCLSKVDPAVLDPIVEGRWLNQFDLETVTRAIECPVLLLQADPEAGGMLTDHDAALMKQIKPNLFHVKYPNAGHQLHWTRRESVVSDVTQFVYGPV